MEDYVLETMIGGGMLFSFGVAAAFVDPVLGVIFCVFGFVLVLMGAYLHFSGY